MTKKIARARITRGQELGEVFDFLRVIRATAHALEKRSLRMQRDLGVSWPQRLVIRLVGLFPGITPTELARILFLSPSTLSTQLKRLELRSLLDRRLDPTDGRRGFLWLTRAGQALNEASAQTVEAGVEALLRAVPTKDIERVKRILSEFAMIIDAPDTPAPSRRIAVDG